MSLLLKTVQISATPASHGLSLSPTQEGENTRCLMGDSSNEEDRKSVLSSGCGSLPKKPKIETTKLSFSAAKIMAGQLITPCNIVLEDICLKLKAEGQAKTDGEIDKQNHISNESDAVDEIPLANRILKRSSSIGGNNKKKNKPENASSDTEDEIPLARRIRKRLSIRRKKQRYIDEDAISRCLRKPSSAGKSDDLIMNDPAVIEKEEVTKHTEEQWANKVHIDNGIIHRLYGWGFTKKSKIVCQKCKEGGSLISCKSCSWYFHTTCVNPPLKKNPDKKWKCPRCLIGPLSMKVSDILSWRWIDDEKYRALFNSLTNTTRKHEASPRREFFVKWEDMSYWHCSWVPEERLEFLYQQKLVHYMQKQGVIGAPDDEEKIIPGDDNDPLYERYYKYGVKPEWLTINRIIDYKCSKNIFDYLVKWRGLSYSEATWEDEENIEIPDFKMFQEIYNEWRIASIGKSIYKTPTDLTRKSQIYKYITPAPKESTCDIRVRYEEQPSFIQPGLRLHGYQMDSLNWLRSSWNNGVNTILADEMGLGKTIQAITFLYSLFKEGHCTGPFIVSAPLSTLVNWEREFELWAPDLYVVTYCGTSKERFLIRKHDFSYGKVKNKGSLKNPRSLTEAPKFHVLLTSYEMIRNNRCCLSSIKWSVMVIDEAHRLKNSKAKFFNDLSYYNTDYKLLLTGTPIQNNLVELFSLFSFLLPDSFKELQELKQKFNEKHTDNEENCKKLQVMLKPHLLRRLKEDVFQDLPSKAEFIVKVELTPMQKEYCKYIITKNFDALNSKRGGHWATLMLVSVDFQKCCNHPYLFSSAMMEAPLLPNEIYETRALVEASGKLGLLEKMLCELSRTGHRVLIFSHFTKMLDILEDFFFGVGYDFERIDGSITGAQRQSAIDRFNEPNSKSLVFLLSTKAGGLGINLATADTVILYDSDWNPHNDIQALSRAHRIGQKNKVMVYRFITSNSIEEWTLNTAMKKMELYNVILEEGKINSNDWLSKQTLEKVIRHGVKSLFQEDSSANNVRDNFTDEIIKDMLDRSKIDADQKRDAGLEFPSAIKTLSFTTATSANGNDSFNIEEDDMDENFWENVVGPHCEQKHENTEDGNTPRVKSKINYEDFFNDAKFLKSLK